MKPSYSHTVHVHKEEPREVMIHIEDLYKSFGDNHVLNGFNMKLYQGENLVVMGKSGSGKSVTAHAGRPCN